MPSSSSTHGGSQSKIPAAAPIAGDAMARLFESALESDDTETPGLHLGPYKLLQEIGEGGFGTVWMAEQLEPIQRRVALKIIKRGMDTKEVIARFEVERQALALMDHPCIARVIDAGATSGGRPFFVMELVRGIPITSYCDEQQLSTEARLRLFIQICQAVQHAHQKGIIHRDLKPSNILVTVNDGVPVPKIIDFGIAKATGTRLTNKTLFTQFHAFIGTPAYTSPEQMEMSSLDVDTRSDIYSLGVLLYELLTGQPPFDPDKLAQSGLDAMRKTIREIDPPRPSQRLATLADSDRTSVAARRCTEPDKLSLLLRGDLDWIVMRCLEKNRMRRYETANALALDAQRYLADEPIAARPQSAAYRIQKFVHRHRLAVGSAAAVSLALVAGLIASSTLLVRERAAYAREEVAHVRAVASEKKESELRQQADTLRHEETKRVSQTALHLADELIARGNMGEALAYLVQAARKDPTNATLAPRLASLLASNNFLLPNGPAFETGSRVIALRFTNDGHSLLAGCEDGTFRRFDASTGALQREFRLGINESVLPGSWFFARDNDRVFAVQFASNRLAVFDVDSPHPRWVSKPLDATVTPPQQGFGGYPIELSADGRWIFSLGSAQLWLWDTETGELVLNHTFDQPLYSCEISPDGRQAVVAAANSEAPVEVWSLLTRQRQYALVPGSLALFSPDGRWIFVVPPSSKDPASARFQMFDAASGQPAAFKLPPARASTLRTLEFAPDGQLMIPSLSEVLLWNYVTGEGKRLPATNRSMGRAIHNRSPHTLLSCSPTDYLQLLDSRTGRPIAATTFQPSTDFSAAVAPNGTQVAVGTVEGTIQRLAIGAGPARPLVLSRGLVPYHPVFLPDLPARIPRFTPGRVSLTEVSSGRELPGAIPVPVELSTPSSLEFPQFSPDGRFLIALNAEGSVTSLALTTGSARAPVVFEKAPGGSGLVLKFSTHGDLVAGTVRDDFKTGIWDLSTGRRVGPGVVAARPVFYESPNFSPDNRRMAMMAGKLMVIDVASGRTEFTLPSSELLGHRAMQFTPDGSRLLTSTMWKQARFWDAATGAPTGPAFDLTNGGESGWIVFSRLGRYFLTAGYASVTVWDTALARPAAPPIPVSIGNFGPGIFTPDEQRLALINFAQPNQLQLWDAATSQLVAEPISLPFLRRSLPAFSPDGRFMQLIGPPSAPEIYVWSIPPGLPPQTDPPAWLLRLAAAIGGKEIDDRGQLVSLHAQGEALESVRRELITLPENAPLADWGRWILNDRPDRSIAPGFTITPAEAERLAPQPSSL